VKINEAEQAEKHQDYKGALATFKDCYKQLIAIRQSDVDWETALVLHRLADCKAKIIELWPKANAQLVAANPPPAKASAPGAVTNPPPNLPPDVKAFQEKLPQLEAEEQPSPEALGFFVSFPPIGGAQESPHFKYPWRDYITVSEFWIGEDGSKASAWTSHWVQDNSGNDSPYNRNGYAAGAHASSVNPFYVALPFNDLAYPDLAQKWLPKGWSRVPKDGKPVSACKDRWVELKNGSGYDCYAQWEDAGPGVPDKAEYVFGGKPAGDPGDPGIDLSPAVAEYLGLGGRVGPVSWRFVDDADVRPGAWLKLDEQAVIYRALHHMDAAH
jgi:hypothetical protein